MAWFRNKETGLEWEVSEGGDLHDRLSNSSDFEPTEKDEEGQEDDSGATELTRKEMMAILDEAGIEYNPRATKGELLALIPGEPQGDE